MTYTIERVATLIGAQRLGHAEARISFVLTDSRSLCFPEETLFFALRSNRNDGHQYISELYRAGCAALWLKKCQLRPPTNLEMPIS